MTHPLTPREKVPYSLSEISEEIRRRYPAAFDGSDPIGLHPPSLENATDLFLSVCLTALASGSGEHSGGVTDMIDHAELAALREHRIAADLLVSTLKADRAEAERKLAEAVGHVEQLVDRLHSIRDSSIVLIAARTFLSKEAERG